MIPNVRPSWSDFGLMQFTDLNISTTHRLQTTTPQTKHDHMQYEIENQNTKTLYNHD